MTIYVTIPAGLEAKLRECAAAAGMDLENFALEALEQKVAGANGAHDNHAVLTRQQRIEEWRSWVASHRKLGYTVDDSRESIYAGRGE